MHYRGDRPGVFDGLLALSTLLVRYSLVELLHGEGLSPSGPLDEGSDLWRELGSQVCRLVAGQPLSWRLKRGTNGFLRVLITVKFGEVLDLSDKLLTLHVVSPLTLERDSL